MLKDLVLKNRSYRRFYQDFAISTDELIDLVDMARVAASGRNAQPLKYILSSSVKNNDLIFETLSWAAYLKDWNGPEYGERPSAYVVVLGDTTISTNFFCDHGIAAQTMLLGAVEKGLGGCIIMSINKVKLAEYLAIPKHFEILMVIALGKPKEQVVIEKLDVDGDYKYWRDINKVHHVPKRNLKDIILELKVKYSK